MRPKHKYTLTKEQVGEITERKLIEAVKERPARWLKSIERSSPAHDVIKGFDALAIIVGTKGHNLYVPIQVRSNAAYLKEFTAKNIRAIEQGVVPILVQPWDHNVEVCHRLYDALTPIRLANKSMSSFLWSLPSPIYPEVQQIIWDIERRRSIQLTNPYYPADIRKVKWTRRVSLWLKRL